jgi:hypothetical protein
MHSVSPRPVKPSPTRRLLAASSRCRVERPGGDVEDVVEHAGGQLDHFAESRKVELGVDRERRFDE